MASLGHYATLQVPQTAAFKDIKKAYYRQVKKCHPDLFGGSLEKEEEFKRLVHAFDILSDPDKRKKYDIACGITLDTGRVQEWIQEGFSVMDTEADDILEELIVGNNPPPGTTLRTLFLDLEKTDVFISFREGKNHFRAGAYRSALHFFRRAVDHSPGNILYRYYLAKTYAALNRFSDARFHYNAALNIGSRRMPPQYLQRVRDELDKIATAGNTVWKKIASLFAEDKPRQRFIDPEGDMVAELNRAIAKITARKRIADNEKKRLK